LPVDEDDLSRSKTEGASDTEASAAPAQNHNSVHQRMVDGGAEFLVRKLPDQTVHL
jgi:hypothetical protein